MQQKHSNAMERTEAEESLVVRDECRAALEVSSGAGSRVALVIAPITAVLATVTVNAGEASASLRRAEFKQSCHGDEGGDCAPERSRCHTYAIYWFS